MPLDNPDMSVIEATSLWKRTLAPNPDALNTPLEKQKAHLRTIFFAMRARVASLVQDIAKDLAEFTIHDVTHLDALWEMADLIAGEAYEVTPAEAFIFGGAVLLHDAGLTLSAYPGGWDEIKALPEWTDGVVIECRRRGMSEIPASMIADPPDDIRYNVLQSILRENHARQATALASATWKARELEYHLIEDQDAREDVGRLIGEIATSHWWSLPEVEQRFSRDRNAPAWCRHAGGIRPLVVACLLRCADAIHLDGRRAPRFNRARLRLSERSALHWDFQERLDAPSRKDDSIYFTGGTFGESDFAAWWLCHELLTMANAELEGSHALLSDKRYPPFAARRIHSQNDVTRLSELIRTEGWTPVDAPVRISNIAGVVRELGGTALYGGNRWVVVRELIQNAADAIRARRVLEHRPDDWGTITVTLSADGRRLTVADTGIGMSQFVIRNYLLDFFSSFWTSNSVQKAFKGRMQQLNPTGKFGIGFFSVFMVARDVKVITRTVLGENASTLVLEFANGYNDRPVLRHADEKERLIDPGTSIEMTLFDDFDLEQLCAQTRAKTLAELVGYVAPTLDVDVNVFEGGEERAIVRANDWRTLDGFALLNRIAPNYDAGYDSPSHRQILQEWIQRLSKCLTSFERLGVPVGRLGVAPQSGWWYGENEKVFVQLPALGVVTSGGLRVGPLEGFTGCIEGEVLDASRGRGVSHFVESELRKWAIEQEKAVNALFEADATTGDLYLEQMMEIVAALSYLCEEPLQEAPVCLSTSEKCLRLADLTSRFLCDAVYVLSHFPTQTLDSTDLTREEILERLRHDDDVFEEVRPEMPDNVVVVRPTYGWHVYVGIKDSMRFTTENDYKHSGIDEMVRSQLQQIRFVLESLWGEVVCDMLGWISDDVDEINVPTRDNGVIREHCAVFRRAKPSNR